MSAMVAASKPNLNEAEVNAILARHGVDRAKDPIGVLGIRGYYRDSMGAAGRNDRGIYDDALILWTPQGAMTFNGNTDPSRVRKGRGTGAAKGMAMLKAGLYRVHKLDLHRGKYLALCQRAGPVTVIRDGIEQDYEETSAWLGINIHNGGWGTTSSLGCQTVHPSQWALFIATVKAAVTAAAAARGIARGAYVVPYLLIEGPVK